MEVNNAKNVSDNHKETQGSRLFLGHDSRIGKKTIPPYRNNYHPQKVLETMNDMRIRNVFCDVTLVADSAEIPAHKMVLASCSPYFYAMFNSFEESKQERITLKEVDHQALVLLIEYAYTSEVMVTEENVEALLPAANLLQFMDVRDACCEFLKAQLHPTNCLGIWAFADIHSCLDLLANSESYVEQHFPEVVESEDFFNSTLQQVSKCISSDKLTVPSEEKVFECVIAWVRHDLENRRHHLASLMEHVRLPLLSQHYLVHRVEGEPLFKVDPQCNNYLIEALKYHLLKGDDKRNFKTPRTKPRQPDAKVLMVAGGVGSNDRSVECFDFKEERWYQVAEMPTGRWGLGLAVLNDKVYAVGGYRGGASRTVDVYDPVLDQWTSCANMSDQRSYLGVAVLDDLIYAVGGQSGSFLNTVYLNTAEVFDTKKQSWKMISPMSAGRMNVGVGVLDGLLYAVGGLDGSQYLSSVECYNPKTDTWLRVPDMLFGRVGAGVGVLNGILYAVGGSNGWLPKKSVEAYDPDKKTWTPVADMAVCRGGAGVVAMNGLLYVVGGYDDRRRDLSSVEVYNPEEDTWTMLTSCMGVGRSYGGVAIIDKSIMKATCCCDKVHKEFIYQLLYISRSVVGNLFNVLSYFGTFGINSELRSSKRHKPI